MNTFRTIVAFAVTVFAVVGIATMFGCVSLRNSAETIAHDQCAPSCEQVEKMTIDKCHDVCDTVLISPEIGVDLRVACYFACEESVLLGDQKCKSVCNDAVTSVFKRLD